METLNFTVKDIAADMKISDYMKNRLGFSTSLITKVKFGGVSLNGEVVTMRATVKVGDRIEIAMGTRTVAVEVVQVADNVRKDDAVTMYKEV